MLSVSISKGNSKMGAIPSVSLPPVTTCRADCPCVKLCYARKLCTLRPTVAAAYNRNFEILISDPVRYWNQVRKAVAMTRFFRFHVSGDIPDALYFYDMVLTAKMHEKTEILAFTKQYEIVNDYISTHGALPQNLHIIFSAWPGLPMDNPHGLPEAHVIFRGKTPCDDWKICGGNCAECACRGVGCWELKRGEKIAFNQH